uniref:Uncharacterized protein n=1 Tax=Octopus bimaculoides TaxID=37653 RepID=A0A0L8H4Y2_OCTBM
MPNNSYIHWMSTYSSVWMGSSFRIRLLFTTTNCLRLVHR